VVGGRSGNRGECAQPCRLPFKNEKVRDYYPLSLKDLSLATHLQELCGMGVSSLKIEGRMKSPEYVRDVTRIWRRLLDEGRDASSEDMRELAKIFSRGGFSDGYYTKTINSSMLGVRSESDKKDSSALAPFSKIERKIPIELFATIKRNMPIELEARAGDRIARATGEVPQEAINAPLSREVVERNLSKLGGTPYSLGKINVELDDNLMLPISSLNALRRSAIAELDIQDRRNDADIKRGEFSFPSGRRDKKSLVRSATFFDPSTITENAQNFFDCIYIPLELYEKYGRDGFGVMLPEVIFDSERERVADMLKKAREKGAERALIGNLGHVAMAKNAGFSLVGDFRLNTYNNSTVSALEAFEFEELILSPELSLAQQRDLLGRTSAIVYGRLPLMITEKCIGKEIGGCEVCKSGRAVLRDRRGVEFPVRQRFDHRSVIFNSVPIYMSDRSKDLRAHGLSMQHFLFTVETCKQVDQVIESYKKSILPQNISYRRIK
jgi:putative protease